MRLARPRDAPHRLRRSVHGGVGHHRRRDDVISRNLGRLGGPRPTPRPRTARHRARRRTHARGPDRPLRENPSVASNEEVRRHAGGSESLTRMPSSARTSRDAAYWVYHVARSSWFLGQALLVFLRPPRRWWRSSAGVPWRRRQHPLRDHRGLQADGRGAPDVQVDLAHINAGTYKAPYDMNPNHRQFNPAYVRSKTARFLTEAASTLRRTEPRGGRKPRPRRRCRRTRYVPGLLPDVPLRATGGCRPGPRRFTRRPPRLCFSARPRAENRAGAASEDGEGRKDGRVPSF